jgi:hypothetical protein
LWPLPACSVAKGGDTVDLLAKLLKYAPYVRLAFEFYRNVKAVAKERKAAK